MGTSRHVSWSHSQEQTFKFCPRAFFLEYFPWGEPYQDVARYLSKVTSAQNLAGTAVHRAITHWLRQYKQIKVVPKRVADHALDWYRFQVAKSRAFCEAVQRGRRPPGADNVLFGHLYGNGDDGVEQGEDVIVGCITNFGESEAWGLIRAVQRRDWLETETDTCAGRSIVASAGLGLADASGLRVYTVFDFAIKFGGSLNIIDWKTGASDVNAEQRTRRQLAGYALWGLNDGWAQEEIRTQAMFLEPSPPKWSPRPLKNSDLDAVRRGIVAHDDMLTARVHVEYGPRTGLHRGLTYRAREHDFPKTKNLEKCATCKFRALCHPEGLRAQRVEN